MPYADFTYYTDVFGGSLLTATSFLSYSEKAQAYIDYMTLGKAASNLTENVKKAVCAAADAIYTFSGRGGLKSENNDGYSVEYFETKTEREFVFDAVRIYLEPSGLLYYGFSEGN